MRTGEVVRINQVIGVTRDSHLFADISGAVLTQCNDIIICDRKLCGILKYDREGSLVKKIGQKGQGRGEKLDKLRIAVPGDWILEGFGCGFFKSAYPRKHLLLE